MDALAFYLPQFHPIKENDEWWGPGFTEWTNVARARPLFRGHVQPHLPGALGFYDLRLHETRERQAELASAAGISAMCWWHYWFAGTRLLERPLADVLEHGEPALPFCLGWANQSWSGVWHGAPDRILVEQTYPEGDEERHFAEILPALRDPRYYRVNDRPLFLVFRPQELPEPAAFVERFQRLAADAGLGSLYLVAFCESREWGAQYTRHVEDGFDAAVHVAFPFHRGTKERVRDRLRTRWSGFGPGRYRVTEHLPDYPRELRGVVHPCVYPNWDNTPRSARRGTVLLDATPSTYATHLREAAARARLNPQGEQLVFIKSWNEWAEGNHLEPDLEVGHGWLEATRAETSTW